MVKVLMIDDDKDIQETIGPLLNVLYGHDVIPAFDGKHALDVLANIKGINIIFCDYNMPVLNGYGFLSQLRNNPEFSSYSNIPIIGIGDFPENKRELLTEFKTKPFSYHELNDLIKKYCS